MRVFQYLLSASLAVLLAACGGSASPSMDTQPPPPIDPPQITSNPVAARSVDGATASFSVTATGSGTLSYQWLRNGTNISGANAANYTTPALSMADDGVGYAVRVSSNGVSSTSATATLTVLPAAPTVTSQPQPANIVAGNAVSFNVQARGTPPLQYAWARDGAAIPGANAATLTLPNAVIGDDGASFTVTVSNGGGTTVSEPALLRVSAAGERPSIVEAPQAQVVNAGQSARFSVAAIGTAPLSYRWQRNGSDLAGATSASYTTPPTTAADDGSQFVVVVSNAFGSATSSAATLTVNALVPPSIATDPQAQTVAAGQSASFSVVADGSAPLQYQWRRNGTPISGATGASYTTPPTTTSDNGASFSVTVDNATGISATSRAAQLTVTTTAPPPPVPLQPADYLVAGTAADRTSTTTRLFLVFSDPAAAAAPQPASALQALTADIVQPRSYLPDGTGRLAAGPAPFVYFVRSGQVMKIDLKRGRSQLPVQVSSVSRACSVLGAIPITGDAASAWLRVQLEATVGGCSSASPIVYVRSDMSAATAPLSLPANVNLESSYPSLRSASDGRLLGLLAVDGRTSPSQLLYVSPDLGSLGVVGNSSGVGTGANDLFLLSADGTDAQAVYFRINKSLRRLSWTDSGASLSPSLYTFLDASFTFQGVTDASGMYFTDAGGLYFLRVRGESLAVLLRAIPTNDGAGLASSLFMAPDHIVVERTLSNRSTGSIMLLSKSGDTFTTLVPQATGKPILIHGMQGDQVVFSTSPRSGLRDLKVVSISDGQVRSIAAGVRFVTNLAARALPGAFYVPYQLGWNSTLLMSAGIAPPAARIEGIVYCQPVGTATDCAGAQLFRFDLASGTAIRMAQLSDGLTVRASFDLLPEYTGSSAHGLFDGLPGSLYTQALGSGTPPGGAFVPSGLWIDRYAFGPELAAPLIRASLLTP